MSATAPDSTRLSRALDHEIFRVVAGSTLNGLDLPGSDRDEVGVFMQTPEDALGLTSSAEHTLVLRDAAPNERSQPGDKDVTLYSLRHFLHTAAKGNPSLLAILWAPDESVLRATWLGEDLRQQRDAFVSMEAGRRFLGYLDSQLARLRHEKGGAPNRPELVEAHGYDTKFASHALRLGLQGVELMRYGRITLPMPNVERVRVLEIKRGERTFEDALFQIEEVRAALVDLLDRPSRLMRQRADFDALSAWCARAYRTYWRTEGL